MKKRIFIFVNGILNNPGSADNWTDRATVWVHKHTLHGAEKFEYFAGPITRRLFQSKHAKNLAAMIGEFTADPEIEVVLVGHSNGCDLICRALKLLPFETFKSIHLISPACDANFNSNGLNRSLTFDRVESIYVHVSEKDKAMKFAALTGKFLGYFQLGYGTLGLSGPLEVLPNVQERVTCIRYPEFSHSTIFELQNFERLMASIVCPE
jgi:hypothetical protein